VSTLAGELASTLAVAVDFFMFLLVVAVVVVDLVGVIRISLVGVRFASESEEQDLAGDWLLSEATGSNCLWMYLVGVICWLELAFGFVLFDNIDGDFWRVWSFFGSLPMDFNGLNWLAMVFNRK
jgi:hypothetical protein